MLCLCVCLSRAVQKWLNRPRSCLGKCGTLYVLNVRHNFPTAKGSRTGGKENFGCCKVIREHCSHLMQPLSHYFDALFELLFYCLCISVTFGVAACQQNYLLMFILGYRVSRSILELVPNKETFRMTLRAVRLWAQRMYECTDLLCTETVSGDVASVQSISCSDDVKGTYLFLCWR